MQIFHGRVFFASCRSVVGGLTSNNFHREIEQHEKSHVSLQIAGVSAATYTSLDRAKPRITSVCECRLQIDWNQEESIIYTGADMLFELTDWRL